MAYYKKQKSVSVKAIAIIMLVVLCASVGVVGWLSDGFKNWDTSTWSEELGSNSGNGTGANNGAGTGSTNAGGNDDVVASGVFDADGNELDITAPVEFNSLDISPRALASVQSGDVNSIEIEIHATVVPFDAADKSCTWSIAWLNDDTTQNISEYLTITADSTDSQNATLEVFDAFLFDTAVLTVTTNDGGHTDTAIITYDGIPDTLEIIATGLTKKSNERIGDYYEIGCNQDLTFDIVTTNQFGSVDPTLENDFEVVSVCAVGTAITADRSGSRGSFNYSYISNMPKEVEAELYSENADVSANIVNSKLNIKTNTDLFSYLYFSTAYSSLSGGGSNVYISPNLISDDYSGSETINGAHPSELPDATKAKIAENETLKEGWHYQVTIKENNSNLFLTINFVKISNVQSVALSQSEINI